MRIYTLTPSDSAFEDTIDTSLTRTLKPHTAPVVVSAVDRTGTLLATGGADGVVKIWDIRGGYITHTFHGHSGLISALHFFEVDPASQDEETSKKRKRKSKGEGNVQEEVNGEGSTTSGWRLASGGEDGKVRVWNLHKRSSAAVLDAHMSVVRTLDYSPEENLLLSGSRDKTVIHWDARSWKARSTVAVLEEVESAGFLQSGKLFYTGGETARLRIWAVESGRELTEEQEEGTETEAIQEILHHPDWSYLLTVHADQTLILHSLADLDSLTSATESIPPLPILRRICGSHGQIIDVAYIGAERSMLALATNSEDVRVINIRDSTSSSTQPNEEGTYFGSDVALLKGHDDIVIAMDTDWSGHWLATGAKDNTARLWRLDPSTSSFECYATFTGHAESLGAVALPKSIPQPDSATFKDPLGHPPAFLITGSQDLTVKKWDIKAGEAGGKGKSVYTRKAHEKDINALAIHHSSQFFASASQDRTVKIWSVEDGSTIGVLKGHKRGVWSVAFSNAGTNLNIPGASGGGSGGGRGFVLTGSGDKTVRVWSLADYSCLMTMEGHTNSVLKVVWLPPFIGSAPDDAEEGDEEMEEDYMPLRGGAGGGRKSDRGRADKVPLVASAAADGLVKIWDPTSGECVSTLDNHTDRVWALTTLPSSSTSHPTNPSTSASRNGVGESLISGAGDGVLTFWTDTTASTLLASREKQSKQVELQQELENHVYGKNWREAISLALQLDQPARLLSLFRQVVEGESVERGSWTGSSEVDQVIASLGEEQVFRLLLRVRDWNTNARNFLVGQRVLRAIVEAFGIEKLGELAAGKGKGGVKEVMKGLEVYGERHFERVSGMWDESFLVEFTLGEMDEVLGLGAEVDGVGVNGGHGADVLMLEA